jgi:RHS repeat-associated protein
MPYTPGHPTCTRRDLGGGAVYYYFTDHLGSSNVVTNASGAIQNESDYLPYGSERVYAQGLTNQNYKFTGKERDTESGLDNFGARYDSSALGRFMMPDWSVKVEPVPYAKLDNPQSLNLYAYVLNNPTTSIDPDGHYTDSYDVTTHGMGGPSVHPGHRHTDFDALLAYFEAQDPDQASVQGQQPVQETQAQPPQQTQQQAQNNGVQGQIAANPPQVDSHGNPTFNPPAPTPPSMGEPAHVGQTGVQTTPTGAVVFTYQVYDRNWNAICCVSVKENVQVLPSTSANSPPVISNHKFVFTMDGKFSDTVGPNFRPAANANFRTETRQTFTTMTDSGTYRISTTIRQSTVVTNGQVVSSATPIVP